MKSAKIPVFCLSFMGVLITGCSMSGGANTKPVNYTVTLQAKQAALAARQTYSVTATTSDPAGVNWTASAGTFSAQTTLGGAPVVFTAPSAGGSLTITATSVSSPTESASMQVYVTDLAGVTTYHNDLARDGANTQEYALTPVSVTTSTFGKLYSCTVDGAIYAQPLWVPGVTIAGVWHNVVYVATQHDSLYAFDADAASCTQLWKANLVDASHGGSTGETPVPSSPPGNLVGSGYGDIAPEVGVTGTPVIDPATGILYVVSKSTNAAGTEFYQRLHAIDLASGSEKLGAPASIGSNITFPGVGDGGVTVTFNPQQQNQRPGLALVNGVVYVAWASHEDTLPYYGWLVRFDASSLKVASILNVSPNVQYGGIWMGGGAPSADSDNNLYLITGNAVFDANMPTPPNDDYGDSFLQIRGGLTITSYFAPSDEVSDDLNDNDFGSGGSAVVLNVSAGSLKHLVIGGGKDGGLYLLNGDQMGGMGDANARQTFNVGGGIFATGAFWNNTYFLAPVGAQLEAYSYNPTTNLFNTVSASQSTTSYGFPGASPSVSAQGTSNGIVWALDNTLYCTPQSPGCGPTVLHAYSAAALTTDLWNSGMVAADRAGNAVKFTVPTIANARVFVGTRGNNTGGSESSTTIPGELDVYGLRLN